MRISRHLVPPGGWEYKINGIIIKAITWNELVSKVRTHKVSNGMDVGNLEEDIEDQIAEENPSIIINGPKSKKKPMGVSFFHTVKSFSQFLWNWKLSGGGLVDQNTANIRASICVACHNNKPSSEVKKGGCSVCNKLGNSVLNKVRSDIVGANKTSSDAKLLTCAVCGCDGKISVWIPNQVLLGTADANAFPSFCWKKKILEGHEV